MSVKKADVINYLGSAAELARKLNISEAAVSQWGDTIPQGRAYQIEVVTGGALKADPAPTSGQQRPSQRVAPGFHLTSSAPLATAYRLAAMLMP